MILREGTQQEQGSVNFCTGSHDKYLRLRVTTVTTTQFSRCGMKAATGDA